MSTAPSRSPLRLSLAAGAVLALVLAGVWSRRPAGDGPCAWGESAASCYRRGLALAVDTVQARPGTPARARLRTQAAALMRASCDRRLAQACYGLATLLLVQSPRDSAVRRRSADLYERGCRGSPPSAAACNRLGNAYAYALGRRYDEALAVRAFQRGCDLGNATACLRARRRGGRGSGASGSAEIARECKLGSPTACIEQAYYTEAELRGTTPGAYGKERYQARAAEVAEVYRDACGRGFPDACTNLGALFDRGDLLAQNPDSARRYYELVCHGGLRRQGRGSGAGCTYLGSLLQSSGAPEAGVIELFREGCELLSPEACAELAAAGVRDGNAGIT
ncbi:MAG TPA: tetratricopeptide repeat protein, partial [Longimicrobium sp.]